MTVLYLCPKCEACYGEPRRHRDCDEKYCGLPFEDVKDKV